MCVHVKRQQKLFIDYLNAKLVEALVAAAFFHVVLGRVFARLERNAVACNLPLPRSNITTRRMGIRACFMQVSYNRLRWCM